MNKYRGIIEISCKADECKDYRQNVDVDCLDCISSDACIVDLEDKVLAKVMKPIEAKTEDEKPVNVIGMKKTKKKETE